MTDTLLQHIQGLPPIAQAFKTTLLNALDGDIAQSEQIAAAEDRVAAVEDRVADLEQSGGGGGSADGLNVLNLMQIGPFPLSDFTLASPGNVYFAVDQTYYEGGDYSEGVQVNTTWAKLRHMVASPMTLAPNGVPASNRWVDPRTVRPISSDLTSVVAAEVGGLTQLTILAHGFPLAGNDITADFVPPPESQGGADVSMAYMPVTVIDADTLQLNCDLLTYEGYVSSGLTRLFSRSMAAMNCGGEDMSTWTLTLVYELDHASPNKAASMYADR